MFSKLSKRLKGPFGFWTGLSVLAILASVLVSSAIPASAATRVEAENYTARSSNAVGPVAITDAGDPSQTGLTTRPSEWTSYAGLDLTGVTSIDLRYSNAYAATSVEIHLGSSTGTLVGTCSLPLTSGWSDFHTLTCGITQTSGVQTVVLVYTSTCYVYLNWLSIGSGGSTPTNTSAAPTNTPTRTNTPVPPTNTPTRTNTPTGPTATPTKTNTPAPPTNTPTKTNTPAAPTNTPTKTNTPSGGVRVEAESYTARSSTNVGAVAITDAGDPSQTGLATRTNEWTSYANLDLTGQTSINLRYSNAYAATSVEVHLGSSTGTLVGTCSLPLTSGWSDFQTINCGITQTSGVQTVVLVYTSTCYAYLNWFSIGSGGSTPVPTNTPGGPTATPTKTNTPMPPTATATPSQTPTKTITPGGPTLTPTKTNTPAPTPPGGHQIIGYFSQWGFYNPPYHYLSDVQTSGTAAKLTIINYAFTNVQNNQCVVGVTQRGVGDAWADYQMALDAAHSVDGVADQAGQPLMGHWNQLRKLKIMHPNLKVVMSIGGWTYSKYFSDAALPANRQAFVASCVDAFIRGNIPAVNGIGGPGTAKGVFDGIDIDWEYPATAGNTGNIFRPEDTQDFTDLLAEFRSQLDAQGAIDGKHYLLTIAAPAGEDKYTNIQLSAVAQSLDWVNLMTYDFHGAWDPITDFLAPLYAASNPPYPPGSIQTKYYADYAVNAYLAAGVPGSKLIMGVPFYGRGWQGVPAGPNNDGLYQTGTGGAPSQAGGANAEPGMDFYRYLKALETTPGYTKYTHPETKAVWIYSPSAGIWWSYDDPTSLGVKMSYVKTKGLAGAMIWELAADTPAGDLINAVYNGLQ